MISDFSGGILDAIDGHRSPEAVAALEVVGAFMLRGIAFFDGLAKAGR